MRAYIILFFVFTLSGVVCGQETVVSSPRVEFPATKHPFIVIAHRGNHEHAPENSLESLRDAISIGVDYVEIDIRTTHDGYMVIMHDATVNRTTSGSGKVSELTLAQWKMLQLKNSRSAEVPPTFEELLQAAKGKINLYLDAKDVKPEEVYTLLNKYQMEHSVVVYTEPEQVSAWKKVAPAIPVMISAPDTLKNIADLQRFVHLYPMDILDGSVLFYTREKVDWLHQQHIAVWPDIQNPNENPAQWQLGIDLGVQALQTDHPTQLIQYLKTLHKH